MAKKIYNHNGEFAHYAPGIIYDIGIIDPTTNTRIPFYVGETSDPAGRLKAHQRAGKNADDESTLVYQTIRALDDAGIEWTMETLVKFDKEGPTDLEDEWIMKHLYSGYKLKNMKKGNANWMAEREACAVDMRKRSISSYRKYKEVITQEELDRKHAEWMLEEAKKTEKEKRLLRAEEVRLQLEAEMAKDREERIAKNRSHEERVAKIKADAEARWEAERPAREARLQAEAQERQAEEQRQIENAKHLEMYKKSKNLSKRGKNINTLGEQITLIKQMILVYQNNHASPLVIDQAIARLEELESQI